jgi:hypothetical protein
MSLEEDLKARTLALISQQMANWVVEIQRHISEHQGNLVRTLDELQETVARYDEKIDESEVGSVMAEVVANQPPPQAAGPGLERLKQSLAAVEKGTSLSEVLTYLVNEVAQYADRAAMFIVKGPSAIGWYGRGIEPAEAVKQVNVPLSADTAFRAVHASRQPFRGLAEDTPATGQAIARLGGSPYGMIAVPLVLRDKLAAILYCDTARGPVPAPVADLIEILVLYAGKTIDLLSVAPRPAAKVTTSGTTAERAAAIRAGGEEVRARAGVPAAAPAPRPAAPAPIAAADEGSSTVMFNAGTFSSMRQAPAASAPPPPPPRPAAPPPPAVAHSPEEQKAHDDARRFARLVVSEIKLYNEAKVNEGRKNKDIYERLKEDIERGRHMYHERVAAPVRESTNYFYDELVRILAGGDQSALGPM